MTVHQAQRLLDLKRRHNAPRPEPARDTRRPIRLGTGCQFAGDPHDFAKVDQVVWERMIDCAQNDGPWPMLLTGGPGTGKTCAALSLLDFVQGSRKFYSVPQLCEELTGIMNGQRDYGSKPDTQWAWWRRWHDADCTVLDDVGARERVSDFHYEAVKRSLDERLGRAMLITTNLSLRKLVEVYDDRIASRLAAGTVIHFAGEDRRLAR